MKRKEVNSFSIAFLSLPVLCLIIGIVMLFFGIKDTVVYTIETRNYEVTDAYLIDYTLDTPENYDPVRKRQSSSTYNLVYEYEVNGSTYTFTTEYSTSIIPSLGSSKEIKYNPDNPADAELLSVNKNVVLICMGLFFTLIPLFMIVTFLKATLPSKKRKKKEPKIDGVGLAAGAIFALFGYMFLFLGSGEFSVSGIFNFFITSFHFAMLIPLILFVVGILVVIKSLFFIDKNKKTDDKPDDDEEYFEE